MTDVKPKAQSLFRVLTLAANNFMNFFESFQKVEGGLNVEAINFHQKFR